jgi:hypothetical protein
MKNPSLDIIVTEHCSTGGCPLEEACEHCYLIQSAISVAISYIISVYCEDYAGYFTVILSFLAFHFDHHPRKDGCSAYFIYLVSCILKIGSLFDQSSIWFQRDPHFSHRPFNSIHISKLGRKQVLIFMQQLCYLVNSSSIPIISNICKL